jgi:hypothetical protein
MDASDKPNPPLPTGNPRTAPPLTKLDRPVHPPAPTGQEDGGPKGPEPTRYNDWEQKGRCTDF